MALEFQESDVVFSDQASDGGEDDYATFESGAGDGSRREHGEPSKRSCTMAKEKTVPVTVPCRILRRTDGSSSGSGSGCGWFSDDDDDGGEMEPPHVILGRRFTGKVAFSVCSGTGRTLKGRDLSQVRNSILRLTGFLES